MINITSPAFQNGETIPAKYTCDGQNINPSLKIDNVPSETGSFVLIMDDPDAPLGIWNHWLVYNIKPSISKIEENSIPEEAVLGINSFGWLDYGGPCPPAGSHRYFFKVYAINKMLDLPQGASREELIRAMEGKIIDQGELMGIYSRLI